jgi:hypothetical protein
MEAMYSSETSADFHWTTLHYIPEDKTLQILYLFEYFHAQEI